MKPSITLVLESYGAVGLPAWGGWRPIRCPFHDDRRASASVNVEEECFRCHACDIRGDAYAVVKAAEGIDFPAAAERVAALTGVVYDAHSSAQRASKSKLPAWTRNRKRKRVFAHA